MNTSGKSCCETESSSPRSRIYEFFRRHVRSISYDDACNQELPQIRAGKIVYPPNPSTVGQIMQRRVYSELVPIHNSPAELAITRGIHLRYRVLDDATGERVPLAKLVVQDSPPREALTDPNGSCDFCQFAPNSNFSLRVLAPEQSTFIDWQDKVELFADLSDDREIRLRKGAVVKGGVNTDKDSAKAKSQAAKSGVMIRHWHDPKRDIHARWGGCWPDTHVISHDGKILYRGQRKTPRPLEDVLDKAVSAAE